MKVIP